jgi:hypothetical protein
VISSALAGVMAGLVAVQLGIGLEAAIVVGIAVFGVAVGSTLLYGLREYRLFVARVAREHGVDLDSLQTPGDSSPPGTPGDP